MSLKFSKIFNLLNPNLVSGTGARSSETQAALQFTSVERKSFFLARVEFEPES